ncbi:MAG: hypothetical protein AAB922_05550 [Patescibacteria group bacterium]
MKKPVLILVILIIIIISLFGVRTVVSNRISTSGVALGVTEDEIKTYKTENALLREKIFGFASFTHVSSIAAEMGFVESKSALAISRSMPIARTQ